MDQYIKPLTQKPVRLKLGDKVIARSPRKEQITREGGRVKSLSIGNKGTKSPMATRNTGGGDSDDEDGGEVGLKANKKVSSSSSSSPAKYSSAAKDEPNDIEEDNQGNEEEKKNDEDQESKDLINSFKSMTGTLFYSDVDKIYNKTANYPIWISI